MNYRLFFVYWKFRNGMNPNKAVTEIRKLGYPYCVSKNVVDNWVIKKYNYQYKQANLVSGTKPGFFARVRTWLSS